MSDIPSDDSDKKYGTKHIKRDALQFKRIVNRPLKDERTMCFHQYVSTGVYHTSKGGAYRIFFRIHKADKSRFAYSTKAYYKKSITPIKMIKLARVLFDLIDTVDDEKFKTIKAFNVKMKF